MKYSRQFFRSHPFASIRRKMELMESTLIKPLKKELAPKELELARLTRRFAAAFKVSPHTQVTKEIDTKRAILARQVGTLKKRLERRQHKYNELQQSLTSPRPVRRKKPFWVRRRGHETELVRRAI